MNMHSPNSHDMYSSRAKIGFEPTFFGRVMSFFALAVFSSAAGVYVTNYYFMEYFFTNPAIMWIFFILELVLIFTSRMWSTKSPLNKFLFAAFTFLTGVTAAPLIGIVAASPEGVAILSKALLSTGLVFTATAVFGWTTKIDLTGMRGFLIIGLLGMIITGIVGIFIPWSNTMEMVYSGIGVLLFIGYTAYDFQKIKHYPEDRYIDAALSLYLDIFNLFMFILRLILSSRRS